MRRIALCSLVSVLGLAATITDRRHNVKLDLESASNGSRITVETDQLSCVEEKGTGSVLHLVGGNTVEVKQSFDDVTTEWIGEGPEPVAPASASAAPMTPPPPPPPPVSTRRGRAAKAK